MKRFSFEVYHPITQALGVDDWRTCLETLLEEAGLPISTKEFTLVNGPDWCDRDSNNLHHGVDYYDATVEGPDDIVAKLEELSS